MCNKKNDYLTYTYISLIIKYIAYTLFMFINLNNIISRFNVIIDWILLFVFTEMNDQVENW